jgi:ATP-dependent Clp protease adaptor protein ClpS
MTFSQARTAGVPETKTDAVLALERLWRVVLLDDPVNLMSYVVLVLRRVFGFDDDRARKHMLETHEKGRSIVWIGPREKAEAYVYSLQEWHLSAILEKDEAH